MNNNNNNLKIIQKLENQLAEMLSCRMKKKN